MRNFTEVVLFLNYCLGTKFTNFTVVPFVRFILLSESK